MAARVAGSGSPDLQAGCVSNVWEAWRERGWGRLGMAPSVGPPQRWRPDECQRPAGVKGFQNI